MNIKQKVPFNPMVRMVSLGEHGGSSAAGLLTTISIGIISLSLRQVAKDTVTAVYTRALLTNRAHMPIRNGPADRGLIRSIIDRIDPVKTF
jgi:hypothetical protein